MSKPPVHIIMQAFPRAFLAIAESVAENADRPGGMFGGRLRPEGCPPGEWMESMARHVFGELAGLDDEDHATALAFNALGYLESKLRNRRVPDE